MSSKDEDAPDRRNEPSEPSEPSEPVGSPASSNPFQAPSAESAASALRSDENWRAIAVRWEWLRIPYNLIVGATGLLGLALAGFEPDPIWLGMGAMVWGAGANLCYLWGPILQMYLCWFAEPKDDDHPSWMSVALPLAAAPFTTHVMFALGLLFSILLTLAAAVSNAKLWPDQM